MYVYVHTYMCSYCFNKNLKFKSMATVAIQLTHTILVTSFAKTLYLCTPWQRTDFIVNRQLHQ